MTKVSHINGGPYWWITSVYGPTVDIEKPNFLTELCEIKESRPGLWLVCEDFNMIYRVEDKSNERLDRRRMGQFRCFLNDVLKMIHLTGRLYTWSSERVCASRPLRYVSVINDNHLVSLMSFNEAKDN
jgi:hypothetical protein